MYTASHAMMYKAASSASVAEDMAFLMMWAMLSMAPLLRGTVFSKREGKVSVGTATCFGFTEVTSIAMDGGFHFTAFVCENGILLCSEIVEELACMFKGVSSGQGGLGGNDAEWDKQGAVNGSAIEQKFSTNLLYELFVVSVKEGCSRRCLCILLCSSIFYRCVWVRLNLTTPCLVSKNGEGFLNVPRHEEVNKVCVVVQHR